MSLSVQVIFLWLYQSEFSVLRDFWGELALRLQKVYNSPCVQKEKDLSMCIERSFTIDIRLER